MGEFKFAAASVAVQRITLLRSRTGRFAAITAVWGWCGRHALDTCALMCDAVGGAFHQ